MQYLYDNKKIITEIILRKCYLAKIINVNKLSVESVNLQLLAFR